MEAYQLSLFYSPTDDLEATLETAIKCRHIVTEKSFSGYETIKHKRSVVALDDLKKSADRHNADNDHLMHGEFEILAHRMMGPAPLYDAILNTSTGTMIAYGIEVKRGEIVTGQSGIWIKRDDLDGLNVSSWTFTERGKHLE